MHAKRPYITPQLVRVELNHEQAILSVCNTTAMTLSNNGSSTCWAFWIFNCKRSTSMAGDSAARLS